VTQGYTGLDFNAAIDSGCTAGTAYTTGQSCTANFIFTPTLPGVRLGAILLYDNGGNLLAAQYISGVGYGPVLQFQPAAVSTAAGNGFQFSGSRCGDGGPAVSANISNANTVVLDTEGNAYIPDISNWVVRKISPTGVISTIAGTLNSMCPSPTSACGDGGLGTAAEFYMPSDLAIDGAGTRSHLLGIPFQIPHREYCKFGSRWHCNPSVAAHTSSPAWVHWNRHSRKP
jgi:hypothetical protein